MNPEGFNTFISAIESRPTYKSHTVLDGGREIVLVLLQDNTWFLYKDAKWTTLTDVEAEDMATIFYFSYRYAEMLNS